FIDIVIISSIAALQKAGRTIAFLLKNSNGKWVIQEKIKLEIWQKFALKISSAYSNLQFWQVL
ncbi:MAG: hypothetical protein WBB11_05390, partial [Ferruginibacter sp.]